MMTMTLYYTIVSHSVLFPTTPSDHKMQRICNSISQRKKLSHGMKNVIYNCLPVWKLYTVQTINCSLAETVQSK